MRSLRRILSLRCEDGQSLIETAIVISVLILLLAGAVDFGRAYYMTLEVKGACQAGATYGSQNPTDTTGMVNVANKNSGDLAGNASYNFSPTASYGCECSDGSDVTPNCSAMMVCLTNSVEYVTVTATATYTPLIPWPGIPSTIPITETVEMRSANFNN